MLDTAYALIDRLGLRLPKFASRSRIVVRDVADAMIRGLEPLLLPLPTTIYPSVLVTQNTSFVRYHYDILWLLWSRVDIHSIKELDPTR